MPNAITLDHIALTVTDPTRSAALFEELFGTEVIRRHDEDGHDETYLKLGGVWLVLVAADVDRPLTGDHVAFHAGPDGLRQIAAKLTRLDIAFQMARADTALYFQDYDRHVFEVNATGIVAELQGQRPSARRPPA